jgi:prepilin-type processing-associated H-X9-DG protein/prepilin-type N-terminal cleavage/methylation domain-containing protein
MSSRRRGFTPKGFTLVELLVVIGVIAVLIALLMPALSKVRKHAQEVHCAANLRSIGQALTMYTQQYGCYPGCWVFDGRNNHAIWPVRLRPFLSGEQGVFMCPARDERFEWPRVPPEPGLAGRAGALLAPYGYEPGEPLLTFTGRRFSYGYNAWGPVPGAMAARGLGWQVNSVVHDDRHATSLREPRASRVNSPAQMIAVADSNGDGEYDFVIHALALVPESEIPGDVHRGGANVLFCDGHVEWSPPKDLLIHHAEPYPGEEPARRLWNCDHLP